MPPIIDEGRSKIQAIVNNGAILPCDSQGLPEPETSWEKDGEVFPTTGLRHQMQRFGSLEFISVRLEDAGMYRCTASNAAGNVSREIQLDVQGGQSSFISVWHISIKYVLMMTCQNFVSLKHTTELIFLQIQ